MAAQRGKDLLLKLDETGSGGFITVAGLRTRRIAFSSGVVDITDSESSGRWRELLAGAGTRQASLSGGGLFRDAASDARIRALFFEGHIRDWQVIVPDFGTLQGPFQITAFDYSGQFDGEVTFDLALESAGPIAFTGV